MQMMLESRVDRLENLMAEVIELHKDLAMRFEERERRDAERERRDAERERRDAERDRRDAERDRRDAERDRRNEERELRNEEQARKDKEEWRKEWKEERKELEKQINKSIAENSKLLGVLVENIIAPGAKPLVRQYFKCEPIDFRVRAMKRKGANNCEVDVLVICEDKAFMIEVKSKPDGRDVKKILDKAETLPAFFSDCVDKQVIPMLASTFVDDNIITFATRKGLYVVAYRQWEYLDILNFDALNKKDTSA
ncbi:MAG: hypothetical protein HQL05_07965 [Nitrospirae bacterium]|uniref:hypothetical protein n=1 Tax=Candidatus Magnetobacterium casense TaxID=1455061 RepID=UPI00059000C9|nr:hypothetical protein [Candidatus Magnetobacterium casensis]MBF0337754.1 hypothetical protein [Nitrospirota bacterium]